MLANGGADWLIEADDKLLGFIYLSLGKSKLYYYWSCFSSRPQERERCRPYYFNQLNITSNYRILLALLEHHFDYSID